jgi:hypothetical protein
VLTLLVEVLYSLQAQVSAPGGQNHHILITSQFQAELTYCLQSQPWKKIIEFFEMEIFVVVDIFMVFVV